MKTIFTYKVLENEFKALKRNKNHFIFDTEHLLYLHLVNVGKIQKPYPKKDEIIKAAKFKHKAELRDELKRAGENHKTVVQNWITNFDDALESKPKMKKKYYGIVQDLILNDYLKECAELGLDFENVIS